MKLLTTATLIAASLLTLATPAKAGFKEDIHTAHEVMKLIHTQVTINNSSPNPHQQEINNSSKATSTMIYNSCLDAYNPLHCHTSLKVATDILQQNYTKLMGE